MVTTHKGDKKWLRIPNVECFNRKNIVSSRSKQNYSALKVLYSIVISSSNGELAKKPHCFVSKNQQRVVDKSEK